MRLYEFGVGKIVKGVNTTIDVGVDAITKQSKKFGNKVDRYGNPPVNPGGKINLKEAVDYNWRYDTTAEFTVGNMKYMVDFLPYYNGSDGKYTVEFQANSGPKFSNSGLMGNSSIQVFGTVIQIIKEFINRENPTHLDFTAEKDDNRVDLYTKLVNKFKSDLSSKGYDVKTNDIEGGLKFVISKDQKLDEAVDWDWDTDTQVKFEVNDEKYKVIFGNLGQNTWEVSFAAYKPELDKPQVGNLSTQGSSSIQVFGTVIEVIIEFIELKKPHYLFFTGDKSEGRSKLYSKFLKKYEPSLKSLGYKISTDDLGGATAFIVSKDSVKEAVIKLGKTGAEDGSPAKQMIADFNGETEDHPYNQRLRVSNDAMANIYPLSNSTVRIGDIQGSGNGTGSAMLKKITNLADKYGVTIKLDAYGYEDKLPTEELVKWYSRNGFSVVDEEDDVVNMIREPR